MTMNDPGWDDAGFSGGSSGDEGWDAPAPGGGGGGSHGGHGPHTSPAWAKPKVLIPAGVVALGVIVLLVVLIANGGGSTPTAAKPTPSTSSATPTPTKTTPKPTPSKTTSAAPTVSLATYDKNVDKICGEDNPKIKTAIQHGNVKNIAKYLNDEEERLQTVQSPDDDTDQARQWINDLTTSLQNLNEGNRSRYTADRKATQQEAQELGMHACAHALPALPS